MLLCPLCKMTCFAFKVLLINGHEVNGMSHDQVVNLIRASRDVQCGELVLTVRPNGG